MINENFYSTKLNSRKKVTVLSKKKMEQACNMKKNDSSSTLTSFDKNLYEYGILWACCGKSLEDATEELLNNQNFIRGFAFGKRPEKIKEAEFKQAKEFYYLGGKLDELPKETRDKLSDSYVQAYYFVQSEDLKQQGRDFYNNGGILELLSDEEREKLDDYFLIGYEDAKMHNDTNHNKTR